MKPIVLEAPFFIYEDTALVRISKICENIFTNVLVYNNSDLFIEELTHTKALGVMICTNYKNICLNINLLNLLEKKIHFEGLRVIICIIDKDFNFEKMLSSENKDIFIRLLQARDIFYLKNSIDAKEEELLFKRIKFVFSLDNDNRFDDYFNNLSLDNKELKLFAPAKISWITQNKLICIETSIRPKIGAKININYTNTYKLTGEVIEIVTKQLRFNFGSSIIIKLQDDKYEEFYAYIFQNINKGLKIWQRSLVIVKHQNLRNNIQKLMFKYKIECRFPLAWKNIKTDIPLLEPNLIIIEKEIWITILKKGLDTLIKSINISEIKPIIIVLISQDNQSDKELLQSNNSLNVLFLNSEQFTKYLHNIIPQFDEHKKWLSDININNCEITFIEKCLYTSSFGYVINSKTLFRALGCFIIQDKNNKFILAKNCRSLIIGDEWRREDKNSEVGIFFMVNLQKYLFNDSALDSLKNFKINNISTFNNTDLIINNYIADENIIPIEISKVPKEQTIYNKEKQNIMYYKNNLIIIILFWTLSLFAIVIISYLMFNFNNEKNVFSNSFKNYFINFKRN